MAPLSDNLRGAVYMMLAMAGFVMNDTLVKTVAGEMSIFQAMFLRGLVAIALIGVLTVRSGALRHRLTPGTRRLLGLRTVGEVGGTVCFLTALFNMPLANATAILQSMPLGVALAAAVFLGESVGWRRYLAIGTGFGGVLIIVRPGSEGFSAYSLWAVAAVGFLVLRDLATRRLSHAVPSLLVTFLTALVVTFTGGMVTAFQPWQPVTAGTMGVLAVAASFLFVGYLFSVMTMRHGEIGFVAPFRYTIMIWAILLGMVVFGDFPDRMTLLGSTIVVGTGVYAFYREQRLRRLNR